MALLALIIGAENGVGGRAALAVVVTMGVLMLLPLVRFGLLPFAVSFFSRQVLVDCTLTTDLGASVRDADVDRRRRRGRPGHRRLRELARRRPDLRPAPGGMTVTPTLRPRARPGHHVEPGDALRPRRPRRSRSRSASSPDLPQARRGRARPRGDLDVAARHRRARRSPRPASAPPTSPPSASPTSAKRPCSGTPTRASRCATRSSGRAASARRSANA